MMLAAILGSKGTLLDYPLWGKDIFVSTFTSIPGQG